MRGNQIPKLDQRGMALIVAMLALLVLAVIATIPLLAVTTDNQISAHAVRGSRALSTAESGVSEALARLTAGDVPDNGNPRMITQIFLCQPGVVPVLGPDSIALATSQPPGQWLDYSVPTRGPDVLTIQYKTDAAQTAIYRYDLTKQPPIQTGTGAPIYVVTSTGHRGAELRTVVTEVVPKPLLLNLKGAFVSGVPVTLSGNSVICGYNHSADAPVNTGAKGRTGAGGCDEDSTLQHWELGTGDLAGVWCASTISGIGNGLQYGVPALSDNQTGFYAGPWEVLGISQAEFFEWVGPPQANAPASPRGIVYLDNNSTSQDQSGAWSYQGTEGDGFLYVDGDLSLNSNFSYVGLIYIEGDLKINGNAWVLGGIVCRGRTLIKLAKGDFTGLYSYDAIVRSAARYSDRFINLSWRELP